MSQSLTERQQKILKLIVQGYTETIEPVSSRSITDYYGEEISSATVRNEMGDLESLGYVTHPHTSAGRIPTDLGYRFYIDHLLPEETMDPRLALSISRQLKEEIAEMNGLIEKATGVLALLTRQAGMITHPEMKALLFKNVEIYLIDQQSAVVVWRAVSGYSATHLLELPEGISEGLLQRARNFFNQELQGLPFDELGQAIEKLLSQKRSSLHELYEFALRISAEALRRMKVSKLYIEGSSFILENPEFRDINKTVPVFQALEKRKEFIELLNQSAGTAGVRVYVGRENPWAEIWDCSLVTAVYKAGGKPAGILAVLGPRRLRYASVISQVGFMAREMTQVLEAWM